MRKILKYLMLAVCAISFASCNKEPVDDLAQPTLPVTPTNINGTWQLTEWNGQPLPEGRYFYIEFVRRGMEFISYENTSTAATHKETGEYNIITDEALGGSVILGRYDSSLNAEWNNRYLITELTATRMVWTVTDKPEDVSVYERVDAIPAEIVDGK